MERRLAAVLAADIVGYSRLMETDELGVLDQVRKQFDAVIKPELDQAKGRVVKTTGDGFLAEFPSVVDAVRCAVAFQDAMKGDGQIRYRAGINIGDVILQDGDIFGDGVNVAARLEAIAPAGGLCISELVWQNLRGDLSAVFQDLGPQSFKNINRQIRVWRWPAQEGGGAARPDPQPDRSGQATLALSALSHSPRDPEAGDFGQGLIDDLTVALGKLDTVRIVPEGHKQARYLVDGNVRSARDRVRCNIRLREAATDGVLWAEQFDGTLDDVFGFQDQINDAVASAIEVELSDGPQVRRWRAEAGKAEAYQLFQEGRSAYKEYARPANARAKSLFQSALKIAPEFLSASVGLARTHIEDAHFGWSDDKDKSLGTARDILDGVLAINPEHSAAHAERSHLMMIAGEFEAGLLAAELSVALDPNDADAHNCLSYLLNCTERYEDALLSARRAVSLNPSSPEFYLLPMVQANLGLGRFDEAVGLTDRILAHRPMWLTTHALRVIALAGAGRHDAAEKAAQDMLAVNPRFTVSRWLKTVHYNQLDIVTEQGKLLEQAGVPRK